MRKRFLAILGLLLVMAWLQFRPGPLPATPEIIAAAEAAVSIPAPDGYLFSEATMVNTGRETRVRLVHRQTEGTYTWTLEVALHRDTRQLLRPPSVFIDHGSGFSGFLRLLVASLAVLLLVLTLAQYAFSPKCRASCSLLPRRLKVDPSVVFGGGRDHEGEDLPPIYSDRLYCSCGYERTRFFVPSHYRAGAQRYALPQHGVGFLVYPRAQRFENGGRGDGGRFASYEAWREYFRQLKDSERDLEKLPSRSSL